MYFMVNTAFTIYLDKFNLTEELKFPILTNKTTTEVTLSIFLNNSRFDNSLLTAPQMLQGYIAQYKHEKGIFYLNERHDIDKLDLETPYKAFFTNNFIVVIFVFIIAKILVTTTMIIVYILFKCNKLRILVAGLPLQQVKEVSTIATKKEGRDCMCEYTS